MTRPFKVWRAADRPHGGCQTTNQRSWNHMHDHCPAWQIWFPLTIKIMSWLDEPVDTGILNLPYLVHSLKISNIMVQIIHPGRIHRIIVLWLRGAL